MDRYVVWGETMCRPSSKPSSLQEKPIGSGKTVVRIFALAVALFLASFASTATLPASARLPFRISQAPLPPTPLWTSRLPDQRGEPSYPICPAPSVELTRVGTFNLTNFFNPEQQVNFTSPANIRRGTLIVYQGEGHSWDFGCNPGNGNDPGRNDCDQQQPLEIARFEMNHTYEVGLFVDHVPDDDVTYQYGFDLPVITPINVLTVNHIQRDIGGDGINSVFVKGVVCGYADELTATPTATMPPSATPAASPTRTNTPAATPTALPVATATPTATPVSPSATPIITTTPAASPTYTPQVQATVVAVTNTPTSTPRPRVEPPTAVTLHYFTVRKLGSDVDVRWATAIERNTQHFVIMRAAVGSGPITNDDFASANQVHAQAIASTGNGSGASYAYTDAGVPAGRYAYWLIETEFDGTRHAYGPAVLFTNSVYLPITVRQST